jgi:hypothetical protein
MPNDRPYGAALLLLLDSKRMRSDEEREREIGGE